MYSSLSTSCYKNEEKYAEKRRIWNERDEPIRKEEQESRRYPNMLR
jgi:hypothetical protein